MTQYSEFYKPDFMPEKQKLGLVAGTTARMSKLLLQRFINSPHNTVMPRMSRDLGRLSKMCYQGSKNEQPDFATTFFLMEKTELVSQQRIKKICSNVQNFNIASTMLEILAVHDKLWRQNVADITAQTDKKIVDKTGQVHELKASEIYTQGNVIQCLRQISQCKMIIGGEVNATLSSKVINNPAFMRSKLLICGLHSIVHHATGLDNSEHQFSKRLKTTCDAMALIEIDPAVPRKNIHPPMPS